MHLLLVLIFAAVTGATNCFTPETLIRTPAGKKRFDEIRVDDIILSRNEADPAGPLVHKRVEKVFKRFGPVVNVHVAGQILRTTGEHPFFVQNLGWTPANELRIGDHIQTEAGDYEIVEDTHTYFVSASDSGVSLWAHNDYDSFSRSLRENLGHSVNQRSSSQVIRNIISTSATADDAVGRILQYLDSVGVNAQHNRWAIVREAFKGRPNVQVDGITPKFNLEK